MKSVESSHLKTAEKSNSLRYLLTKFDKQGWAAAERALPIPFDLVTVLTNTNKKIPAWWNKCIWEGLHLKKEDKVIKWKRRLYEHLT